MRVAESNHKSNHKGPSPVLQVGEPAVKERGILFKAEMVRAILQGRKTQTRRIVQHQDERGGVTGDFVRRLAVKPKQGKVGERLWVRETFYCDYSTYANGGRLPAERPDWADDNLYYRADGECCQIIPECSCGEVGKPKWRPSLLMPRWASRITLEITGIRAQRLQDISDADAWAEGIGRVGRPLEALANLVAQFPKTDIGRLAADDGKLFQFGNDRTVPSDYEKVTATTAVGCYAYLWESINGPGSWAANPWVWVIEFKKL